MSKVKGKTVIVTGASRGIGAEIAKTLAREGASVVVNYAGSREAAENVVDGIKQEGGEAAAFRADVSKADDVKALFGFAIERYGKVDVLVNNAAIMQTKPIRDFADDEYERHFEVNVRGVFNTLREADARLADNGIIINLSSSVTRMMLPGYAVYAATKGAVEQMSRAFAKEIGRGISVNVVSPGPTRTELFLNGKTQEQIDRLISMNVFNRLGEPEDIVRVVLFLAGDDSRWISGQIIPVNGGMV